MAPYITAPDPIQLLPPLLACLPAAFVSPRLPPALLPLLSPILRQRVQLLSSSGEDQSESSWLPLLCWDPTEASELTRKVEDSTFEPHPVSGEIELGDVGIPVYRRKDEETLQALLKVPEFGLQAIYLWCEHDEAGGGLGWRLTELRVLDLNQSEGWSDSVRKANHTYQEKGAFHLPQSTVPTLVQSSASRSPGTGEEDDDDDYWARYDATPGRTPAPPQAGPTHIRTTSESEYYSRYAGVEHTIHDHDSEEMREETAAPSVAPHAMQDKFSGLVGPPEYRVDEDMVRSNPGTTVENIVHTRPSSSSSAPDVTHLEESAQNQSQAEMAVQQHISTSIKSLFRLAKGAGLDRAEFQRLARTELDLLEMWDAE